MKCPITRITSYLRTYFHTLLSLQIIASAREEMKKNNISEQTMIGIVWTSVMSYVEWNKKEELVTEQAIKHLKVSHLADWLALISEPSLPHLTKYELCGEKLEFTFSAGFSQSAMVSDTIGTWCSKM